MSGDPFAGKAEWFDRHYGTTRGRIRLALVLERLLERLPARPVRVLDAGGGTGAFAVPLAERGHEVVVLDRSEEWLEASRRRAERSGVSPELVAGPVERVGELVEGPFDVVLCHGLLMYLDDPEGALRAMRSLAAPGALLSALEKNRHGLSLRPALQGRPEEALRLLDDPRAAGNLGIENTARSIGELRAMLLATGWVTEDWAGVRLYADMVDASSPEAFEAALELERRAGGRDPHRRLARLLHLRARPATAESLEMVQARTHELAGPGTRSSLPAERALSGPELAAFLDRRRFGLLTTARPDGRPHATMVAFVVRDGRLWLPAVAGAVRVRNLREEPWASFVVSEGEGDDHVMVSVEGEARLHTDPAGVLDGWLRAAWRDRFGGVLDWAATVVELVPARVLSYGRRGP